MAEQLVVLVPLTHAELSDLVEAVRALADRRSHADAPRRLTQEEADRLVSLGNKLDRALYQGG
jgi:hypothetical protein